MVNSGIVHKKNFDIYYSCDRKDHALGVGFVVGRRLKQQIIDWKPVHPRICVIRIKSKFRNISLINVHAPTEEKDETNKNAFYDMLEGIYDNYPRNDVKIIAGDLNAKDKKIFIDVKQENIVYIWKARSTALESSISQPKKT